MADTGRQSPLAVNVLGSVLQNTGLNINPVAARYMGASKTNDSYTFGSLVSSTSLRMLTWAINDGYERGVPNSGSTVSVSTYNNLISIGSGVCEALGNAKPPTYIAIDPAGIWARTSLSSPTASVAEQYGIQKGVAGSLPGPATAGYGITSDIDQGQEATWYPYTGDNTVNPNTGITKWGWLRCHALQAWNEFNYNGSAVDQASPEYKEFLSSFMSVSGYIADTNQSIHIIDNANTFLDGVYSNMNDLTSADIAGISLSGVDFGTDLSNLGKVIDLKKIETFGMPSNLLMAIGKAGAITQDLGLALLAAGLTKDEISSIVSGIVPNWSKSLEQKIFGAFLIITGENLAHVLAPLQCRTQGIDTLADLLNLQKLFPLSYQSLAVPVYNATLGLPTNSKTYYLIYQSGGVNPALNTNEIQNYVGTIIPKGLPPIYSDTSSPQNYNELPKGFGSYLDGVIPVDWATAAGAFSYSMRQITNIENVKFETFAKVAKGIENMSDLPLVAGTSKPTDQAAIDISKEICSLGSGQAGSYTTSDFFGCMSGLPYPWKLIQKRIQQVETQTLYDTYKELYLAVIWEGAVLAFTLGSNSPSDYFISSLSIVTSGGGYGRGGAPAPNITLPFGASATCTIGTNANDIATFGRLTGVTLVSGGSHSNNTGWYADIQCPPTSTSGGTNTASGTTGWASPMNAVVQNYIDQANAEIVNIVSASSSITKFLNQYWNILGTQLAREQRARYTCFSPVTVPKDYFATSYPNTSYIFLDSIARLARDTRPHMTAQTLESISNMTSLGGQSLVGKMREERNQARLQQLGIELDNGIPNTMSPTVERTLLANGTVCGAVDGIASPNGCNYTFPAWPSVEQDGQLIEPVPSGYYIPSTLQPEFENTGFLPTSATDLGDITPILNGDLNPVVNPLVPAGPVTVTNSPIDGIVIIAPPDEYNLSNLPANLDPNYTNSTMMPATLSIQQAIDKVIECNCDCWVN